MEIYFTFSINVLSCKIDEVPAGLVYCTLFNVSRWTYVELKAWHKFSYLGVDYHWRNAPIQIQSMDMELFELSLKKLNFTYYSSDFFKQSTCSLG